MSSMERYQDTGKHQDPVHGADDDAGATQSHRTPRPEERKSAT